MTSLRFVLGLLIMAAATKADTMGVFITSQFQGIVGVSLAAMVLMRRQGNPFAAEGGETEHGAWSMERGVGKWGRKGAGVSAVASGLSRQASAQKDGVAVEQTGGKQLAADGGVVRTMPIRTPKRIASWMPRRVRAAVVAQYAVQAVTEGVSVGQKDGVAVEGSASAQGGSGVTRERPRQVAVPYHNYRRYRG
jgi:hypothetical protein